MTQMQLYRYILWDRDREIISYLIGPDQKTIEIHRDEKDQGIKQGDILIARVRDVVSSIQAAFVILVDGEIAYLPLDTLKDPVYTKKGSSRHIQQGDELVVQVSREAMKGKYAAVSAVLSLRGRYAVVSTDVSENGVSKKLSSNEREHFKQLLARIRDDRQIRSEQKCQEDQQHRENAVSPVDGNPGETSAQCTLKATERTRDTGILIRTEAQLAGDDAVTMEVHLMQDMLTDLTASAVYKPAGTILYREEGGWLTRISRIPPDAEMEIISDSSELLEQTRSYMKRSGRANILFSHYDDPLQSMEAHFSLKERIREAVSSRVWLRSGAFLVIEPTEALTSIDVNTGKMETNRKKSDKEQTVLRVNKEACREIARQMRLRSISGTVIVDIIGMQQEDSRQELLRFMQAELAKDPVRAYAVDITRLQLMEITRQKVDRPLSGAGVM